MNNSIFITNSGIDKFSGGGIVSYNIVEVLKSCTELRYILSKQKFPDNRYNGVEAYTINPKHYGYKDSDPFFEDYIAFHLLQKIPTELVVTYGCPMGLAVEECKREFFCKVVCDLAPHNIEISKEEHIKFTGGYPFPHLTDNNIWGLYSRHLRFADRVVVHSNKSADYIKNKAKLNIEPDVIPHGCHLPEIIPDYPEKIVPGYMGAIGHDKGIVYLINAWLNMPHDSDTKMVIAGREAEDFKLQNEEHMKFFNPIGHIEKLSDFYKKINIYIQPSVTEGFGITTLEAMAHGRPVIVGEGAGVSELVENGKNGFVVPIRNIKAIKEKIQYFKDNPEEIKKIGKNARQTAEKYTWDIINKRYTKLFEELL